jgi:hypothetical protein
MAITIFLACRMMWLKFGKATSVRRLGLSPILHQILIVHILVLGVTLGPRRYEGK